MAEVLLTDAAGKSLKTCDVGDFFTTLGPRPKPPQTIEQFFDYLPDFKCRSDDVMLLSYPKTGTNWLHEILNMLLRKSAEPAKNNKIWTMLEINSQKDVDKIPAPRVINTHLPYRFLPKDLKEKQIKTVLVVRNPKDTLVSFYNHMTGIKSYGYDGTWEDWFQLYMKGRMEYGMYTDYLKEYEKALSEGAGFPLHIVHYEDLKMNGPHEIRRLADFLGVELSEDLVRQIMDKTSFDLMKKTKGPPRLIAFMVFRSGFQFFRKDVSMANSADPDERAPVRALSSRSTLFACTAYALIREIGDWKNWFTESQNEQFERYWQTEMADSNINFTYLPPDTS